jgi:hypothetical protein
MKIIKVTTTYGNEWINSALILQISRNGSGSIIDLQGSASKIFAIESPEEIIELINI